jgi:hypothetical protein
MPVHLRRYTQVLVTVLKIGFAGYIRAISAVLYCAVFLCCFAFFSDVVGNAAWDEQNPAEGGEVFQTTDFPSYYYGAVAISMEINPYDVRLLASLARADGVKSPVYPYLYPPPFASLLKPLAQYGPRKAESIWTVAGVLFSAIVFCLTLFFRVWDAEPHGEARRMDLSERLFSALLVLSLLVVLPFRQNLEWGQVNLLVLVLVLGALLLSDRTKGEWSAGFFLAAATMIKVTPALLVVLFLVKGRLRSVYGFFFGVFILAGFSIIIDGWSPWAQFFTFLPSMGYGRNIDGLFHPSVVANFSLSGFWMRALQGSGPMVRMVGMLSALTLFVMTLYVALRTRGEQSYHLLVLPFTVLMVIASPLAWRHHLVYLLPGLFLAVRSVVSGSGENRKWVRAGALIALAAGSTMNYSPAYGDLNIPEVIRPIATSLNLYCLLGLLFVSLANAYRLVRRPAGEMERIERPFDMEGVLPEQ